MAGNLLIDIRKALGERSIHAVAELETGDRAVTVLFGPSGSGKTTILRAIAGLDSPDDGVIRFGDTTWFDRPHRIDLEPQQRRVGYLSQRYDLFPHLTVRENVGYGAARDYPVDDLLERFGIAALADRRPAGLSGGEQQRTALARTLAREPQILLLDEPLSALDTPTREILRGELRAILRSSSVPAIVVTHDRTEALTIGDRIAVVVDGRIAQTGDVDAVFNHPLSVDVARATGIESVVPVEIVSSDGEIVVVRRGERELEASGIQWLGGGDSAFALIRAHDVTVDQHRLEGISARNQLAGTIISVAPEDPLVRLRIDCGFELVALITRRSFQDLALSQGSPVVATIKASAIRLVPRAGR